MNTNNAGAQQIIELYRGGHSLSQIGHAIGTSRDQVRRMLTEAGVPIRSREEALKLAWKHREPSRKLRLARLAKPRRSAPICALCSGKFTDDDKPVKGTKVCRDCLGTVALIAKRHALPLGEAARRWKKGTLA